MRRIWILLTVLALTCSAAAQAPTAKADEGSCRAFVQDFYNWHVAHGTNFEKTFKQKRSALATELGNALAADLAASKKNSGEIVGLDFDPFTNSQDPSPRYRVETTSVMGPRCLAEVHGVPSDRKGQPDATAELEFEKQTWKFVNFHYGSENGPDNENLVSVLRALKRDREKSHGK